MPAGMESCLNPAVFENTRTESAGSAGSARTVPKARIKSATARHKSAELPKSSTQFQVFNFCSRDDYFLPGSCPGTVGVIGFFGCFGFFFSLLLRCCPLAMIVRLHWRHSGEAQRYQIFALITSPDAPSGWSLGLKMESTRFLFRLMEQNGILWFQSLVQQFDPMPDWQGGTALNVSQAPDIRRRNQCRFSRLQRVDLVLQQFLGQLRLEDRVSSRRAAAQMRIRYGSQLEACASEQSFNLAKDLKAVLERTRRVKRDAREA